MEYQIEIAGSPAHELITSLHAYISRKAHKTLDLGADWAARVKAMLDPDFAAELAAGKDVRDPVDLLSLLALQCPPPAGAADFLDWLAGLTPGELYERLSPHVLQEPGLPADLGAVRDEAVRRLRLWHDQYFRTVAPELLALLAADRAARQAQLAHVPPAELLEDASGGMVFAEGPGPRRIVLVPQYHHRPFNVITKYRDFLLLLYAVEVPAADPEAPSPRLMRQARAIADESRLKILRYLGPEPRTFTEIVAFTGLALSTVHHHMITLRAAGLVRLHDSYETPGSPRYSLRPAALGDLGARLSDFLKGE